MGGLKRGPGRRPGSLPGTQVNRETFKAHVRLLAARGLMNALKILWVRPLDRKKVLFSTFDGRQYSDSPKYVYLTFLEKEPERSPLYYWAANGRETCAKMRRMGLNAVNTHSLRYLLLFTVCGTVVVNQHIATYLPVRKNQVVLNIWHGSGPGKTVGILSRGATVYDKMHYALQNRKYAAFLTGCTFNTHWVCRESFHYQGEVLEFGLPRNSVLLRPHDRVRQKVREAFGVEDGTGMVLYAPTFREGEDPLEGRLDARRIRHVMEERFGKPFVLLYRAHHASRGARELPEGEGVLDACDYPDMQELLCASDVLITDYSSSMNDMALTGRPVFLFVPDKDAFMRDRGLYWPVERMPYPWAEDSSGLEEAVLCFDEGAYRERVRAFFEEIGLREGPDSALKTYEWLRERVLTQGGNVEKQG